MKQQAAPGWARAYGILHAHLPVFTSPSVARASDCSILRMAIQLNIQATMHIWSILSQCDAPQLLQTQATFA